MKPINTTQKKLLAILNQGGYYSGTELGSQLEISRAAIWKSIGQLQNLGIPIISSREKGYCLITPIVLLSNKQIFNNLKAHPCHLDLDLNIFQEVESTNLYLKQNTSSSTLAVCVAETQSKGRGRFERRWHSPFGENIYLSARWKFQGDLNQLSALSLVTGLTVKDVLSEYVDDQRIKVKWPNDLLWEDKKICGILIEIQGESHGVYDIIIGIGLNINSTPKPVKTISNNWSSLYGITGLYHDRNQMVAKLIIQLNESYLNFINHGFKPFQQAWQKSDYLQHQTITIQQYHQTISGVAMGVNQSGLLKLKTPEGDVVLVSSGDATLKKEV